MAQELDIDYHMSGSPFFDLRKLDKQRIWTYLERQVPTKTIPYGRYIKASIVEVDHKWGIRESPTGWLKIYEVPREKGQYIVSGDTAEGLEKSDETVGVVRNKYTLDVCAVFNGQYTPDDHAYKLFQVAKLYNNAKIAPENNNHGYSVCSDLKAMDCDLYWTSKEEDDPNGREKRKVPVKAGFTTSSVRRPLMLDQLAEEVEKSNCELRDEDLILQCKTFINNPKGKAEADGNFLDDLVLATAIGSHVIKEYPYVMPKPKKKKRPNIKPRRNMGIGF